jgi:hypothetical protein
MRRLGPLGMKNIRNIRNGNGFRPEGMEKKEEEHEEHRQIMDFGWVPDAEFRSGGRDRQQENLTTV